MENIAPPKADISIDELEKVDIRVGTIVAVLDVPNSAKLVHLKVDFGFATRSVVVGMKQERDDPKEVEGKQALFVVNLPAREMAGVRSEAMLFDVGYADGLVPALAVPEHSVPNGARAG